MKVKIQKYRKFTQFYFKYKIETLREIHNYATYTYEQV